MNKKSILGIGALMSVLTCSLALALAPNKVAGVRADYTPTNDHFVAMMHENSGILDSITINTAGSGRRTSDWLDTPTILSDMDASSNITWTVGMARYENKVDKSEAFGSITLGHSTHSVTDLDDETFNSIINGLIAGGHNPTSNSKKCSIMYSNEAIYGLDGITLAWNYAEAGTVYFAIKEVGSESWTYVTNVVAIGNSHDTGTKVDGDWNYHLYRIDKTHDYYNKIRNKNAQVAIIYSNSDETTNYCRVNAIIINQVNAIKAKINRWSVNSTDVCGDGTGSFFNNKSMDYCDMMMCAHMLDNAYADQLNTAITVDGAAKEATYYAQFAYLCDVAGISLSATPSSSVRFSNGFAKTADGNIIIVACLSTVTLVSVAILVLNRKKKHN